mgnify:FL=1
MPIGETAKVPAANRAAGLFILREQYLALCGGTE